MAERLQVPSGKLKIPSRLPGVIESGWENFFGDSFLTNLGSPGTVQI